MDKVKQNLYKSISKYFEDTDYETFTGVVDLLVYFHKSSDDNSIPENIATISGNFLKENDIVELYYYYRKFSLGEINVSFHKYSRTELSVIEDIFEILKFIHFFKSQEYIINKKKEQNKLTKQKNYLKTKILEIYNSINNYGHYFYSKEEDAEFVKKIEKNY